MHQENLRYLVSILSENISPQYKAQLADSFMKSFLPSSRVIYRFIYWNLTENISLTDSAEVAVQKAVVQCRRTVKECARVTEPMTKGEKGSVKAICAARRQAWSVTECPSASATVLRTAEAAAIAMGFPEFSNSHGHVIAAGRMARVTACGSITEFEKMAWKLIEHLHKKNG